MSLLSSTATSLMGVRMATDVSKEGRERELKRRLARVISILEQLEQTDSDAARFRQTLERLFIQLADGEVQENEWLEKTGVGAILFHTNLCDNRELMSAWASFANLAVQRDASLDEYYMKKADEEFEEMKRQQMEREKSKEK